MTTQSISGAAPTLLRDTAGERYRRNVRLEVAVIPKPPPEPDQFYFSSLRRFLVTRGELEAQENPLVTADDREFRATFEDLYINFNIPNVADSSESPVIIEVYNVSDRTGQRIIPLPGERTLLRLWAGYRNKPNLLFVGQARTGGISVRRPNSILRFHAEQIDDMKRIPFVASYEATTPGRTRRSIVEHIVSGTALLFQDNALERIPADATVGNFVSEGTRGDALTALLEPIGLKWFIHNGFLGIISKRDFDVYDSHVVEISQETGMIDIPDTTDDGIEVDVLLTSLFVPGQSVRINTKLLNTTIPDNKLFRIAKVMHQGDNWTDKMITRLTLEDPEKVATNVQLDDASRIALETVRQERSDSQ